MGVLFTGAELFDMAVLTVVIGFVFSAMFRNTRVSHAGIPIDEPPWKPYALAAAAIVPGILLHEFFHKFVALGFGAEAVFNTSYTFLAIAVVLKLIGSPFLFIAPAYVAISGALHPLASALIGFSGPFANLLIWIGARELGKRRQSGWLGSSDGRTVISGTARINKLLFWFNLLPIPGFDGFHVVSGVFRSIGGLI